MNRRGFFASLFAAPFLGKLKSAPKHITATDILKRRAIEEYHVGLYFNPQAFSMKMIDLPLPTLGWVCLLCRKESSMRFLVNARRDYVCNECYPKYGRT